jgi:hypothetical protein
MTDSQELDLSNPETIERLKKLDVTKKKEDPETEKVEEAIKTIGKLQKFTVKLNGAQAAQLLREASTLGKKPTDYLQELVESKVFAERIGAPLISRCSQHTQTVFGPSGSGQVRRG